MIITELFYYNPRRGEVELYRNDTDILVLKIPIEMGRGQDALKSLSKEDKALGAWVWSHNYIECYIGQKEPSIS